MKRNRKPSSPFPAHDKRTTRGEVPLDKEDMLKMLRRLEAQLTAPEPKPAKEVALPPPPPEKHLPEDQIQTMLKMAEASLRQFGEIIPPREVFYMTGNKLCPKCEHSKPIVTGFGFKKAPNGQTKPQSWCNDCRNSPASHPTRLREGRKKR